MRIFITICVLIGSLAVIAAEYDFEKGKHHYEIPLLVAVQEYNTNTVRKLLAKGTDVNVVEKDKGWSALMFACYNNDEEMARMLMKAGAHVNCRGLPWDRMSPLLLTVEKGNTNLTAILLKAGADVNAREAWGISPLMQARSTGRQDLVDMLRKSGAKEFELVVKRESLTREDAEMLFHELTQVADANSKWFRKNEEKFQGGYQIVWNDIVPYVQTNLPIYVRGGKDMLGNAVVFGRRPPGTRHRIRSLAVSTNTVDILRPFTGNEQETMKFWGSYYPIELTTNKVSKP